MNTENIKKLWEAYVEVSEKKLDPVDDKAVDKKFKNRKDKDIDNDGDVDSSDEYLHKRRAATDDAIDKRKAKKEEEGEEEKDTEDKEEEEKRKEKEKKGMSSKTSDSKAEISKIGETKNEELDELDEGFDTWTVTVKKPVNKLKKGQSVKVQARNTSEAMKKALKKWGEDSSFGSQHLDVQKGVKESVELDEAKMNVGDTVRIDPKSKNIVDRKKLGKSGFIKSKRGKDYLVKFADGSSVLAKSSDLEMVKEDSIGEAFEVLWNAIEEAKEPKNRKANATEPEGIMDKESPKSKEFADKHKKSDKDYEDMPKDAAEKTTKAGQGVKSQAPARPGDNMKGDKKVVNPVKEDTRSERQKIMDILSGKTWNEIAEDNLEESVELQERLQIKSEADLKRIQDNFTKRLDSAISEIEDVTKSMLKFYKEYAKLKNADRSTVKSHKKDEKIFADVIKTLKSEVYGSAESIEYHEEFYED